MRLDTHGMRAIRAARRVRSLRRAPRLGVALLALLGGSVPAIDALAADVELAWDQNPEPDVVGYKLYYDVDSGDPYSGTDATEGASPIDIPVSTLSDPTVPTYRVTGLNSCQLYYFALTAYNATEESGYSAEISATVAARPEPAAATTGGEGALDVRWPPVPDDDDGTIARYRIFFDTATHADWERPPDPPYEPPYAAPGSPVTVLSTQLSDPAAPSWVLAGLQSATTYYLRVEARCFEDVAEPGRYSEEVSAVSGDVGTGGSGTGGSGTGGTGNSGTGGSGTGGSGTGATGAAPAGGTGPGATAPADGSDDASEEEGCGCELPGRPDAGGVAALGVAAVLALGASRRSRRCAS